MKITQNIGRGVPPGKFLNKKPHLKHFGAFLSIIKIILGDQKNGNQLKNWKLSCLYIRDFTVIFNCVSKLQPDLPLANELNGPPLFFKMKSVFPNMSNRDIDIADVYYIF